VDAAGAFVWTGEGDKRRPGVERYLSSRESADGSVLAAGGRTSDTHSPRDPS